MATWDILLRSACEETREDYIQLAGTLTPDELHREFHNGYGSSEGCAFTMWGPKYVYFPIVYDGAEWVGYAPRNPCDIKMKHQGGE